ncbi:hypothetical protein Pelo_5880 [Pelomyxa schiedti]|nr:hypothetical protein Pelo_5880 [Pelomyxa schiedti]
MVLVELKALDFDPAKLASICTLGDLRKVQELLQLPIVCEKSSDGSVLHLAQQICELVSEKAWNATDMDKVQGILSYYNSRDFIGKFLLALSECNSNALQRFSAVIEGASKSGALVRSIVDEIRHRQDAATLMETLRSMCPRIIEDYGAVIAQAITEHRGTCHTVISSAADGRGRVSPPPQSTSAYDSSHRPRWEVLNANSENSFADSGDKIVADIICNSQVSPDFVQEVLFPFFQNNPGARSVSENSFTEFLHSWFNSAPTVIEEAATSYLQMCVREAKSLDMHRDAINACLSKKYIYPLCRQFIELCECSHLQARYQKLNSTCHCNAFLNQLLQLCGEKLCDFLMNSTLAFASRAGNLPAIKVLINDLHANPAVNCIILDALIGCPGGNEDASEVVKFLVEHGGLDMLYRHPELRSSTDVHEAQQKLRSVLLVGGAQPVSWLTLEPKDGSITQISITETTGNDGDHPLNVPQQQPAEPPHGVSSTPATPASQDVQEKLLAVLLGSKFCESILSGPLPMDHMDTIDQLIAKVKNETLKQRVALTLVLGRHGRNSPARILDCDTLKIVLAYIHTPANRIEWTPYVSHTHAL